MQPTCKFPDRVTVRANSLAAEGLAVRLAFGMTQKNPFNYLLFLGPGGFSSVSGEELLRDFREEWSFAIMDYIDPQAGFTGQVTANVVSNAELQGALEAFERFRRHFSFPAGYEKNLRAAVVRRQDPEKFSIELEVE